MTDIHYLIRFIGIFILDEIYITYNYFDKDKNKTIHHFESQYNLIISPYNLALKLYHLNY